MERATGVWRVGAVLVAFGALAAAGCSTTSTMRSLPVGERQSEGLRVPASAASSTIPTVYVSNSSAGTVTFYGGEPLAPAVTGTITGLSKPTGLAVDPSGNLYVAEAGADDIRVYSGSTLLRTLKSPGKEPMGVAVGADGTVYAANLYDYSEAREGSVSVFKPGATTPTSTLFDPAFVLGAEYVAVDSHDDVFVTYRSSTAAMNQFKLVEFPARSTSGAAFAVTGAPIGVAFDRTGRMVVDVVTPSQSTIETLAGGTSTVVSSITIPRTTYAFALDSFSDRLYSADEYGGTVREFDYPGGPQLAAVTDTGTHYGIAVSRTTAPIPTPTPSPSPSPTPVALTPSCTPPASGQAVWTAGTFVGEYCIPQLIAGGNVLPVEALFLPARAASADLAFDASGDLWALSTTGTALYEYTPAQLAALRSNDAPAPAVTITSSVFPANAIAFDPGGNLWASVPSRDGFVELPKAQLASSGAKTPSVVLYLGAAESRLRFDAAGDLWFSIDSAQTVAGESWTIFELKAASIQSSGSPATVASFGPLISGGMNVWSSTADWNDLAFDAAGDLWGETFGYAYEFAKSQLSAPGAYVAPVVQANLLGYIPVVDATGSFPGDSIALDSSNDVFASWTGPYDSNAYSVPDPEFVTWTPAEYLASPSPAPGTKANGPNAAAIAVGKYYP